MGNTSSKEEVKLLTRIGEGSYAEVYEAEWKNKQVAAKKLHCYLLRKTNVKQKFKEEWELLSGLNHPNIVKYLTAVIPESPRESAIIVTELLDQDLRRFITTSQTNPKVTFRDTVSIMLDVAEGLKYLHQLPKPIVHRDLACKNILLTVTKRAKIADFGIAKCFPGGEMNATGNPGTPATRAPETFGKSYFSRTKYGTKADIFSFGVVGLEVIVGHLSVPKPYLHTEGKFSIDKRSSIVIDCVYVNKHKDRFDFFYIRIYLNNQLCFDFYWRTELPLSRIKVIQL